MGKVIVVSGTPGTGKTTLARYIAKQGNVKYISGLSWIRKNKLDTEYDYERKCYVVNEKKFSSSLKAEIKNIKKEAPAKSIIIDSHLAHELPANVVDLVIITKCNLKELKKRLSKRKYSENKVNENLECEIMDICLMEAKEKGHEVLVVNTSFPWKRAVKEYIKKIGS